MSEAVSEGYEVLDLTSVEFVSRSVADELVHQSETNSLDIRNPQDSVAMMIEAVDEKALA